MHTADARLKLTLCLKLQFIYVVSKKPALEDAKRMMTSMLVFFSLGYRCMIISVPYAMFVIGPVAFVFAAVSIIVFFYYYDFKKTNIRVLK